MGGRRVGGVEWVSRSVSEPLFVASIDRNIARASILWFRQYEVTRASRAFDEKSEDHSATWHRLFWTRHSLVRVLPALTCRASPLDSRSGHIPARLHVVGSVRCLPRRGAGVRARRSPVTADDIGTFSHSLRRCPSTRRSPRLHLRPRVVHGAHGAPQRSGGRRFCGRGR